MKNALRRHVSMNDADRRMDKDILIALRMIRGGELPLGPIDYEEGRVS